MLKELPAGAVGFFVGMVLALLCGSLVCDWTNRQINRQWYDEGKAAGRVLANDDFARKQWDAGYRLGLEHGKQDAGKAPAKAQAKDKDKTPPEAEHPEWLDPDGQWHRAEVWIKGAAPGHGLIEDHHHLGLEIRTVRQPESCRTMPTIP